jgi:predicted ATP-binding protein involved in virulence
MKLNSLTIENFRCFEQIHLTLHPQLTVLIAPNGAGKTTLLDAARIAVWPFVKAFDLASQTGKSATIQNFKLFDRYLNRLPLSANLWVQNIKRVCD